MNTGTTLSDFQWDALLRGIEQDRCVICVGPEFYTSEEEEKNQSQRLSAFLQEHQNDLGIRVRENGWYHLQQYGDDGAASQAVREFYLKQEKVPFVLLDQLAQLKTHLILSLTPDHHLADAFARQGFRYRFDAYVRNEPDRNTEAPTQDIPLVYNLSGDLNQRNSLVLTYNDFYDYIQSTFRGNSMSLMLKDHILSADYFVFLGIPLEDWRMHLFLRILKQHESRKNKYAPVPTAEGTHRESWQEQYNIRLVNEDIASFVKELHRRCSERGLLREKLEEGGADTSVLNRMRQLVGRGDTDESLDLLKEELRGVGDAGRKLALTTIQLQSRQRELKDQFNLGIIRQEDYSVEQAKISHALLQTIDDFGELQNQIGLHS